MCKKETIRAWEKKNGVKLPKAYEQFVTRVGRKRFHNLNGLEGLDVRIVGPRQLDCESYRRDYDEDAKEQEPDGLMFAIAGNGDCLCFDLRTNEPNYPVFYFDHETESFESYATDFTTAVRRLFDES